MANKHAQSEWPTGVLPRGPAGRTFALLAVALVGVGLATTLFNLDRATVLATTMALALVGLLGMAIQSALASTAREKAAATDNPRPAAAGKPSKSAVEDPATPLYGKRWSLDVFAAIDAQRFAAVCETWFSWAGFDTRSESHRTDEGVDIWLHAANMPGPVAIVRCKHWLDRPVGLQEMQEFLGVVAVYQSAHGTYTTTSTYTPEALQFAKEHGIDAVDGRGLLRRIQTRTRQSQQALLAVAYSGQA